MAGDVVGPGGTVELVADPEESIQPKEPRKVKRFTVKLRKPHPKQEEFRKSTAKRKIICAGRRGGKTTGVAIVAAEAFLKGIRVLYGTPTTDQLGKFWREIKNCLGPLIAPGVLHKNETEHYIEMPGTEQRIRAKTAWNADTLRGDYADLLILDEFQMMQETAWEDVGAPMLLDNNGDAIFIYTPPSLRTRAMSRAKDPLHAMKMFKEKTAERISDIQAGRVPRWETFHFTSFDNPHISEEALKDITLDMTQLSYRQEIMAEDIDEVPGALWTRKLLESCRVKEHPALKRIVVAIDPSVTSTELSDEAGIVVGGIGADGHGYLLKDVSKRDTPKGWAATAVREYHDHKADRIVAEVNNGGEMVELVIGTVDDKVSYRGVHASRGKLVRAEPITALYEKGFIHHVGAFPELEDELCSYVPGDKSPNRLDANVWLWTELMLRGGAMGLVEYLKGEQAKMDEAKTLMKPEVTAATKTCPHCKGIAITRVQDGWRCNQCGTQFGGKQGPAIGGMSRKDALAKND